MTKDVLLSISGLHQDVTGIEAQGDEPGSEPIEVIVPASYYEMTRRSRSSRAELRIPTWYSRKIRSI